MFLLSTTPPPAEIYTLSLHDALPISTRARWSTRARPFSSPRSTTSAASHLGTGSRRGRTGRSVRGCERCRRFGRSEEHTSELQSRLHLVCRLLLEKKKIKHDLDSFIL